MKQQQVLLFASNLEAEKKKNEIVILNTSNEVRVLQLTEAKRKLAQQTEEAKVRAAEMEVVSKDKQLKEQQLEKQKLLRNSLIAGTFLIFVIGILFFNRYRISQRHKQQAERMRISSDLHDEIGSTLSSIGMYSSYAKEKPAEAKQLLEEISSSSQEMIDNMNDIIWAINPRNDSFSHLTDRLRNYSSRMAQSKNILLHFSSDESLSATSVSTEERKNLFLICKEAINNAVKYAECKNLFVSMKKMKKRLLAEITDDGSGFDTTTSFEGNGLKNMKQRTEDIHATLSIHSEKEKGTRIELAMNIA
jgi:signal transduction histidine kinase